MPRSSISFASRSQEVRERRLATAVASRELAPRVGLSRVDEGEHLAGIEPELAVERLWVALRVTAVLKQPRLDLAFELALVAPSRGGLRDVELTGDRGSDERLAMLTQECD